jgi:hypothetical protein
VAAFLLPLNAVFRTCISPHSVFFFFSRGVIRSISPYLVIASCCAVMGFYMAVGDTRSISPRGCDFVLAGAAKSRNDE